MSDHVFMQLLAAVAEEHNKVVVLLKQENELLASSPNGVLPEIELIGRTSGRTADVVALGPARSLTRQLTRGSTRSAKSNATGFKSRSPSQLTKFEKSFSDGDASEFDDDDDVQRTQTGENLSCCGYISSRLRRQVQSNRFELCSAGLIIANTIVMAFEVQYNGLDSGYSIGFPSYDRPAKDSWVGALGAFYVLECIFTILFSIELVLRIAAFGSHFFRRVLNLIDVVAVGIGIINWVGASASLNPFVLRLLRMAKIARGLRLAKVTRIASSLHFLVKCIALSVEILFWSLCLLVCAQCIGAMILSQFVQTFIQDANQPIEKRNLVFNYYGTFTRSMITMFEVHLANWAPACRVLLDNIGEELGIVFVLWRCFVGFAILNVINSCFVQQTLRAAEVDRDLAMLRQRKANRRYTHNLVEMFRAIDISGSMVIPWDDFQEAVSSNEEVKEWLQALEISHHDIRQMFRLLDADGDGELSLEEVIIGAPRIKGNASSIDIACIMLQLNRLETYFVAQQEAEQQREAESQMRKTHTAQVLGVLSGQADMQKSEWPTSELDAPAYDGEVTACATSATYTASYTM